MAVLTDLPPEIIFIIMEYVLHGCNNSQLVPTIQTMCAIHPVFNDTLHNHSNQNILLQPLYTIMSTHFVDHPQITRCHLVPCCYSSLSDSFRELSMLTQMSLVFPMFQEIQVSRKVYVITFRQKIVGYTFRPTPSDIFSVNSAGDVCWKTSRDIVFKCYHVESMHAHSSTKDAVVIDNDGNMSGTTMVLLLFKLPSWVSEQDASILQKWYETNSLQNIVLYHRGSYKSHTVNLFYTEQPILRVQIKRVNH